MGDVRPSTSSSLALLPAIELLVGFVAYSIFSYRVGFSATAPFAALFMVMRGPAKVEARIPVSRLFDRRHGGLPPAFNMAGFSTTPSLRDRRKLRIASFIALSGPAGIWGPASVNTSVLGVTEINRKGGILGREVELVIRDAGGEIGSIVRDASDMVQNDDADIVIGSHTSAVRVALREVVAKRLPYIYPPVYEGGERTPGVMAIGETPRGQSRPAIQWLADTKRAKRWYLIGSDYVWPWQSHRAIKRYIGASGGGVIGEEFVPMGVREHDDHIARIKAAAPDVVLMTLIGTHSITFNRAFAAAGLSGKIIRFCCAMDETVLLGIGADNTENIYCSAGYFSDAASRENDAFRGRYLATYGVSAPPVGAAAESNYEALKFLEATAARAGSVDRAPLLAVGKNIVYGGPRGQITMHDGSAEMPIHLAEAVGLDFRLLKRF